MADEIFDLIIIGAGPAGISAAYQAKKAGLSNLVIEKGLIGNTIYNYPVGLTVFSTTNELEFRDGDLKPAREKPTREELLSYYVRFVLDNGLNVQTEETVLGVTTGSEPPASAGGTNVAIEKVRLTTEHHGGTQAGSPERRRSARLRRGSDLFVVTSNKGVFLPKISFSPSDRWIIRES